MMLAVGRTVKHVCFDFLSWKINENDVSGGLN